MAGQSRPARSTRKLGYLSPGFFPPSMEIDSRSISRSITAVLGAAAGVPMLTMVPDALLLR